MPVLDEPLSSEETTRVTEESGDTQLAQISLADVPLAQGTQMEVATPSEANRARKRRFIVNEEASPPSMEKRGESKHLLYTRHY
jgi:hypothetical protein